VIYNPSLLDNNIVTSRIRLARNIDGLPFDIKDLTVAKEVVKKTAYALDKIGDFTLYTLLKMPYMQKESMKENHLISNALTENSYKSAVFVDTEESVSIMVHEEDVFRFQCMRRGLSISDCYKKISAIDDSLSKTLNFAFDKKLGYLTACPTNLGTGLRASVMLFLPALTESKNIKKIIEWTDKLGLTVRGVYGEGSKADGCLYQISNEVTLGVSERDIISEVEETILTVCESELNEEKRLYSQNQLQVQNRCYTAYQNLKQVVAISYKDFLRLITDLKLGVILGYFDFANPQAIDDLAVSVRPMTLCYKYGVDLTERESAVLRAEVIRKALALIERG